MSKRIGLIIFGLIFVTGCADFMWCLGGVEARSTICVPMKKKELPSRSRYDKPHVDRQGDLIW